MQSAAYFVSTFLTYLGPVQMCLTIGIIEINQRGELKDDD